MYNTADFYTKCSIVCTLGILFIQNGNSGQYMYTHPKKILTDNIISCIFIILYFLIFIKMLWVSLLKLKNNSLVAYIVRLL